MKTKILNPMQKAGALLLIVSLGLTACRKEQNAHAGNVPSPLSGNWKLVDQIRINNEDGKPRTDVTGSPVYVQLNLFNGGQFGSVTASGASIKGDWSGSNNQLNLENVQGAHFSAQIASFKTDTLILANSYEADSGFASGATYFSYTRN